MVDEYTTGEIVQVAPQAIAIGRPITIYVDFNAYAAGLFNAGTHAEIIATSGNLTGKEAFYSISGKIQRVGEPVKISGVMPNYPIALTVVLRVRQYGSPIYYKWITVDSIVTEIGLPGFMPSVTPLPPVGVVDDKYTPQPGVMGWSPTTSSSEFPFTTEVPTIPKEKQTWLWVGLAVVGVIAVGLLVK